MYNVNPIKILYLLSYNIPCGLYDTQPPFQWRRFLVMSRGTKCRGTEGVSMPLRSGTDIIFLVNYIISMWLKH